VPLSSIPDMTPTSFQVPVAPPMSSLLLPMKLSY